MFAFHNGQTLFPNITIGVRPKIGAWDKLKSCPLKAVSKFFNLIGNDPDLNWMATEEEIRPYKIDWNGGQMHAPEVGQGDDHPQQKQNACPHKT